MQYGFHFFLNLGPRIKRINTHIAQNISTALKEYFEYFSVINYLIFDIC